jgi:aspartate kinase
MNIIVEKYGGSSVGSIERIKKIAQRVVNRQDQGYRIVVVVSAMGDTTDDLLELVNQITANPRQRELGMLLSTGEVISSSLVAMAIQSLGRKATALTGAQAGISTDGVFDNARIIDIDTSHVIKLLSAGEIVVMAGYQGKIGNEITVLGRGGSDASAVALAAALDVEICDIYTDVQGVYTADPRIVKDASLLQGISYEEMIELAVSGAQIMMARSVEIARNYNVKIRVSSSFENCSGTIITKEDELEKVIVTGVAVNKNVAMIDIFGIKNQTQEIATILSHITEQKINIILFSSNSAGNQSADLSLVVKPDDVSHVEAILQRYNHQYKVNSNIAKVSLVGSGIANQYGVAYQMFDAFAQNGIDILMTSTSEIKIATVIPRDRADEAVQKLHEKFQLNHLQRQYKEL